MSAHRGQRRGNTSEKRRKVALLKCRDEVILLKCRVTHTAPPISSLHRSVRRLLLVAAAVLRDLPCGKSPAKRAANVTVAHPADELVCC